MRYSAVPQKCRSACSPRYVTHARLHKRRTRCRALVELRNGNTGRSATAPRARHGCPCSARSASARARAHAHRARLAALPRCGRATRPPRRSTTSHTSATISLMRSPPCAPSSTSAASVQARLREHRVDLRLRVYASRFSSGGVGSLRRVHVLERHRLRGPRPAERPVQHLRGGEPHGDRARREPFILQRSARSAESRVPSRAATGSRRSQCSSRRGALPVVAQRVRRSTCAPERPCSTMNASSSAHSVSRSRVAAALHQRCGADSASGMVAHVCVRADCVPSKRTMSALMVGPSWPPGAPRRRPQRSGARCRVVLGAAIGGVARVRAGHLRGVLCGFSSVTL